MSRNWGLVGIAVSMAGQTHCARPPTNNAALANDAPSAKRLPASMKGYELYAWEEAGRLRFTLITGTNRQKTLAEVTENRLDIRSDERVVVSGEGIEKLEQMVSLVPADTSVVFATLPGLPPVSSAQRARIEGAIASPRSMPEP